MSVFLFKNLTEGFSFENDGDSDGIADFWTASDSANTTFSLDSNSAKKKHGSYSQRVVAVGTSGGVYQDIKNILPSTEHTAYFWNRVESGTMDCIVQSFNSTDTYISSPLSGSYTDSTLTRNVPTFTTPANTSWLRMYFRQKVGGGNATFNLDCVALSQASSLTISEEPFSFNFSTNAKHELHELTDGSIRKISAPSAHDTFIDNPVLGFMIIPKSERDSLEALANKEVVFENHLEEIFNMYVKSVTTEYIGGTDPTAYNVTLTMEDKQE